MDEITPKKNLGGRPKGSLNKEVQGFLDLLQAEKFDPAMALIRVAQGNAEWLGVPEVEMQFRLRAMETLISYVLPKRKAIEIKAEVTNRNSVLMVPAPMTAVEWEKMVQEQMKIAEQETINVEAEKPDAKG